MEFQEDISTQRLEEKIDREIIVLVDEVDEDGAHRAAGRRRTGHRRWSCILDGDDLEVGDFVRVRITDCDVHDLYAERIE
jgi:ribosomal protein S12 methylthiotransferase